MGAHDEDVAVVDENNNVINFKKWKNLTDGDCWRIISLWVENDKGEVLLQQRSMAKKLGPGLWTPAVEGTVDGNDGYLETAIREAQEEIGLTGHKLIPAKIMLYKSELGWRWAQGYKTTCNWPLEKFVLQAEEVEQIAWRDKQEVIREIKNGDSKYPTFAKSWLTLFDIA